MSVQTALSSCGGGVIGLTYSSEYPLPYSEVRYYYDSNDDLVLKEFFSGSSIVPQFRHIMEYDDEGNIISLTIE